MEGPVYGEQLAYFPELFDMHDILSFDKVVPAGLTNRKVRMRVNAYLTRNRGGKMGIENNSRTENQVSSFYVEGDEVPQGLIAQGLYVEEGPELFVFVQDNGYAKEGDFHVYLLQLVQGNTNKQRPAVKANLGINEFQ
jgi:hypothetical protein